MFCSGSVDAKRIVGVINLSHLVKLPIIHVSCNVAHLRTFRYLNVIGQLVLVVQLGLQNVNLALGQVATIDKVIAKGFLQVLDSADVIDIEQLAEGVCQQVPVAEFLNLHIVCCLVVGSDVVPAGSAEASTAQNTPVRSVPRRQCIWKGAGVSSAMMNSTICFTQSPKYFEVGLV